MEGRNNPIQNGQHGRRVKRTVDKEQYYTSRKLVEKCVARVSTKTPFANFALVVEPSAGEGAFLEAIPAGVRKVGIDIDPRSPEVIKANFFEWLPETTNGEILVIGNPPFGQRAALAVRFIEHASSFANTIAFILPRSFNKYTFINRIPRRFHLEDSFDCEEFVLADGTPIKVKCVFQIWVKSDKMRPLILPRNEHPDFKLCHCHISRTSAEKLAKVIVDFPLSIPQVGSNLRIKPSTEVKSGSHWFIHPKSEEVTKTLLKMDFGFLAGMNTAFTSLSKRDIIRAYDEAAEKTETSRSQSCPDKKDQLELGF